MIKINAIGDACPLPVIKAKKALKESSEIIITVDNEIATQNLTKMAEQLGFQVQIDQQSATSFQVAIFSGELTIHPPDRQESSYIVVIDGQTMGSGNDELGSALMKAFIYSLTEQDILPTHIIFYNGGAKLTTKNSEVLEDLNVLMGAGVEMITCGACLDFFGLTEKLTVGIATNMYRILELMSQYHVVKP